MPSGEVERVFMTRAKVLRVTRRSSWSETQLRYQKSRSPLRSRTSASAPSPFSLAGGTFLARLVSASSLAPSRALLTEFYTTNLSVAAFPFEPPEPQRFAAQRTTHEWAEGRKRRWSMEVEATGLGRAEGGSAGGGGGGVRHVPLQVACPYAEKEGVTVGS